MMLFFHFYLAKKNLGLLGSFFNRKIGVLLIVSLLDRLLLLHIINISFIKQMFNSIVEMVEVKVVTQGNT